MLVIIYVSSLCHLSPYFASVWTRLLALSLSAWWPRRAVSRLSRSWTSSFSPPPPGWIEPSSSYTSQRQRVTGKINTKERERRAQAAKGETPGSEDWKPMPKSTNPVSNQTVYWLLPSGSVPEIPGYTLRPATCSYPSSQAALTSTWSLSRDPTARACHG